MIIELPGLHSGQQEIKESNARFKVVACGRRWGKTRLAALLTLEKLFEGGHSLWIAPSYQLADIGWRLLEALASQINGVDIKRGEKRIVYKNGWVAIRSAESSGGLRGEGLDFIVADGIFNMADIRGFLNIRNHDNLFDGGQIF